MLEIDGRIYIANIHYPWTHQRGLTWNLERAHSYLLRMKSMNRTDYNPDLPENKEIIHSLNKIIDRGFFL